VLFENLKRIISIFIVLLIVFNTGGYFFIYFQLESYFKQIAFNRINEFLPLEELQLIKIAKSSTEFSNSDIYDRKNEKEFSYYGNMYDIFKEDITNDTLFLYCVSDENEDIIHNAFASYINEKKNDNKSTAVINIIKIFITIALPPYDTNTDLVYSYKKNINLLQISYQNFIVDVPSPPPRFSS
jgi:hypothetical protein